MTVFYAVIPIILNAAVGFAVVRRQIFDQSFLTAFSRLTFRYFIPCLLFASVERTDLGGLGRVRLFWLAYFLPAVVLFLMVRLRASPSSALAVVYSNTVLIGIPLILRTFGDEGLGVTLTVVSLNGLTLFTIVALTGAPAASQGTSRLGLIFSTLRNPIIVALLLGAAFNLLAIPIWEPLLEAIDLAGRAALPCALFVLGASLAGVNTGSLALDRGPVARICLLKLFLMPALVLVAARQILRLDAFSVSVLVTLAACPSGINVLPFAQQSERELRIASAAIFVSTIVSIITLPAWLYLTTRLVGA